MPDGRRRWRQAQPDLQIYRKSLWTWPGKTLPCRPHEVVFCDAPGWIAGGRLQESGPGVRPVLLPDDDSAAADWLQAVAFGVFDAQSNGNLLYWNTLATPKTIQQGDFGQFAPGSLVVEED